MRLRCLRWLLPLLAVALAACGGQRMAVAQGGVALDAGWTRITYPGATAPVDVALTNVAPAVEAIWHRDAQGRWYAYFAARPLLSSLPVLERGEAYWVRASQPVVWAPIPAIDFASGVVDVVRNDGATFRLEVELADGPDQRSRGLMFRQSLPDSAGMLFRYAFDTRGGFWMQNTYVPLSIAFIDGDGRIVDILEMEPLTTEVHTPRVAYRWALEVHQGWYEAHGVGGGDLVRLVDG